MEQIFANAAVIWFLIGLLLFLGELVLPGLIVFFFGVGAWVVALCCLLFDIGLNAQLLIFLLSSIISLALLRKAIRQRYIKVSADQTGDMEEDFIGKTAIALEDFDNEGRGKVSFKGTNWDAESKQSVVKGQPLRITGFSSIRLHVEPTQH